MANSNSPEFRTIIQCTPELTTTLKNDLVSLSGELLAAGLIADDNAAALNNQFVGAAHRVAELVGFVRNRVMLDTNNYLSFIKVLQLRQDNHKNILEILGIKYRELGGEGICHNIMAISHSQSEPTLPNTAESVGISKSRSASTPSGAEVCGFSTSLSDDEFSALLRKEGLKEPDCKKLSENCIGAQVFPLLTDDDVKQLKLSLGGNIAVRNLLAKIKESNSVDGASGTSGHQTNNPNTACVSTTPQCSSDGPKSQYLSIDDLGEVYDAMQDARSKWYHIGLELRIGPNDLDAIVKQCNNDLTNALTETLSIYLRRLDPKPTWSQLADALGARSVGFEYLAERVRHRLTGGKFSHSFSMKCPVCLNVHVDPCTLSCGHTFCQDCLAHMWKSNKKICPVCKETWKVLPSISFDYRRNIESAHGHEVELLRKKYSLEDKELVEKFLEAKTISSESLAQELEEKDVWRIPGVKECDERSVVIYSFQGQLVKWNGLKLHIHAGSLPKGLQQCTIFIKASLAGEYEIPENTSLVSALFWLRCEPQCIFIKPITVEIQHCSTKQNLSKLKIVRAMCSQKTLPYKFKPLEGGRFDADTSYGVVEVTRFSGFGIIEERTVSKRLYYNQLFYCDNEVHHQHRHDIHIIYTWNTEAHIHYVNEKYSEQCAGCYQVIELDEDVIKVGLEETKWTKVMDGQWEIYPIKPVVTKAELDDFKTGLGIPNCVLEAHPLVEPVPRLLHEITMNGVKPPYDKLTLRLPIMPSTKVAPTVMRSVHVSSAPAIPTGGMIPTSGHVHLNDGMSDEQFVEWLRESGMTQSGDRDKITGAGINAQSLPCLEEMDVKEVTGQLSLGGRAILRRLWRQYRISDENEGSLTSHLDTELGKKVHYKITRFLKDVPANDLRQLGGALGLSRSKLLRKPDEELCESIVSSWLRMEDEVLTVGKPTLRVLANHLKDIGQTGLAHDVISTNGKCILN